MKRFLSRTALRTARGFTLIELLVVVAIIALLITILLPSLNQARVLSRRTACAANLKGIATATLVYAEYYDQWIPTGNNNNAVNDQYRVYQNTSTQIRPRALGYAYRERVIGSAKIYFCPDQKNTFWTSLNQNLLDPESAWNLPAGANAGLRSSYSSYMAPDWNGATPNPAANSIGGNPAWVPYIYQKSTALFKVRDLFPPTQGAAITFQPGAVAGFIMDVTTSSTFISNSHETGVNVAFVDGAVSYIRRNEIVEPGNPTTSLAYYTDSAVFPGGNVLTSLTSEQMIWNIASRLK